MTQPNQWGGQGDFNSYQQAGNWNSGNSTNPSGSWSGQNSWSGQSSVPNQNANNWNQNWGNNQAPNTIGGANAFPVNQALNPDGSNAAQSDATNKIDPELAEFDSQFKTWEGQFAKWKDENKDHPDKTALAKYEEQWTKWRDDLLARRQEIISSKKDPSTSDSGPSAPINSGLGSQTQWGAPGGSNQPQGSNSWNQGPNWSQGPNQANNSWDPNQGNPPNWANNNASQAPNPTVYGANPGQNMPVQNQNWNQSSQNTNQGHPGWQGPNHQFQNFGVNQNPTGPNWGPNQTQNFPTNQVPNGPNQNWVPNQTQQGGTNQGSNWGPNQNWNSHQPSNVIPGASNDSQNIIGNVPPPQRQPPNQSGQMNNWVSNGPHSNIDSNQVQAPMMPGLGAPPNGPNQVNHSMRPNQGPPHMGPQGVHPMGPNQGHPSMGLNQGPPSMGLNQGPPSMAFNQGPPPMGPNQGPTLMGPSQGQPPIGPNQGPPPMGHTQAPSPMGPNQHNSAIPNLGHNMSEPYGRSNQVAPNMVPHPNISNVGPSQMGQYVPGQTKGPNNAPYVPSMGVNDSSQSSGLESHDNSQNKDSEIKSFLPNEVKDMGFNSQSFGTRGMNQGLGMGPRGPIQGPGLGPRGPIQGPGIGPRGPIQGPGLGPRGPIQGPGIGPRGPIQGPGLGPRGPIQGPGIGPRGPVLGPGMGPRGTIQGPGMGPRGPNQGLGMGPRGPNQGMGPRGPNQGMGPRGPNQGMGPRGPNQGMGPRGPNQGPGMGPRGPNQGPGMGPRGPNQGPGMGPRGPNQGPRMGFQAQQWNSSNQGQQWQANDCNPGKTWGAVNNANPENEKLVENPNFQDSRSFRGRGHSRKSSRFDANPNEAPPSDVNINMSWKTGNQNWTGSERETKVFSPSFETLNAQSNKGDSLATLKLQKSEALEVSGGIPGLDIPADDEIKEQKPNMSAKKNSPAKPMKTEEEKQPELKFGDNRLNIGPIGVAQKLNNWKPSGDWYDDDDPDNQDGNKMGTNDDNFGNKKRSAQLPDINPAMNKVPRMSAPQGPRGGMQGPRPLMSIGTFDPMPPFSGGPRSPIGRGGPRSPIGRGGPRSPIGRGGPRGTIGMGGPRGHPRMGGSRGPIGMDGPRGPSRMDGPRGPSRMDGPRGPSRMDGPRGHPRMGGPRGPPGMGGPRGPLGPRSSFRGGPPFGGPPMMGRGGRGIRGRGRGSPFFEVGPLERGSPPSSHYSDNFYDLGVSEGVQPIITKVVEYGHKGQQSPIQVLSPITPSSENLMEENQSIVSQCDTSLPSSVVTPNKVSIEDLLEIPGRFMRPPKLVIILRGLPGSGKTTIAKMIKEKEILNGGSAARILCLDDYFMVESEKLVIDEETGRKIKTKVMEYEYEPEFEDNYRKALIKSFKKQIDEKFFPFIIIDCVNGLNENYKEMCDYCTKKDFEFYIGEIEVDVQTCFQRNTRKRSLIDLQKMALKWERTPSSYTCVDLTSLIQDANIEEVQMEDSEPVTTEKPPEDVLVIEPTTNYSDEEDSEATTFKVINELMKSKWDTDQSQEEKLDKLDGVRAAKKKNTDCEPQSIDDWLQLSENFTEGKAKPGKKTVRWADIEERREQLSARHRGFVLGQTNWNRMTDPSLGSNALVQVRYIEPRPNKEKTPVP